MTRTEATIVIVINAIVGGIALIAWIWTAAAASRAVKALRDLQDLSRRNADATLQVVYELKRGG